MDNEMIVCNAISDVQAILFDIKSVRIYTTVFAFCLLQSVSITISCCVFCHTLLQKTVNEKKMLL